MEPFIGYNIDGMAYFFYIPFSKPECLTLQRYEGREGVDPHSFDGSRGELDWRYGGHRWSDRLDLAADDCGYFNVNEVEQVRIITEFFRDAFAFGQRLMPEGQSTAGDGLHE